MPKTSTSNTTTDRNIEEVEQTSVSVTFGDFPISNWKEYDKDCKENFGDCRWMKAWHDHKMTKQLELIQDTLIPQINELREKIQALQAEVGEMDKDESDDDIKLLGGDKIEER